MVNGRSMTLGCRGAQPISSCAHNIQAADEGLMRLGAIQMCEPRQRA